MKPIRHGIRRSFFTLRKRPLPTPRPGSVLPQDRLVDEEIWPGYKPKHFYPATPGEVLADRYQILVKVGWGTSSTVWFARDMQRYRWQSENIVALKIINNNRQSAEEREIEERIATADVSHDGRSLFRTYSECFEITGPHGRHLCLAYEPMREPLWLFRRRFKGGMIPLGLVKIYIKVLLMGLDYLHTKCKIVHTDLKLDNIMVSFEDPTVLDDFMNSHFDQSMEYKIDKTGRLVYQCQNEFGPLRKLRNIPMIVDFGTSTILDREGGLGIYPIQPNVYRAPEVILGCGWRMSADIWNLGVLLWDLIESRGLFQYAHDKGRGRYDSKYHLAEMIALLGPPPQSLITRSQSMMNYNWPVAIKRDDGKLCKTAKDYFHGPFFDEDGRFMYSELIPDRKLADTVHSLEVEEREGFLSFAKMMLAWLPEERKTACELIEHPFLQV